MKLHMIFRKLLSSFIFMVACAYASSAFAAPLTVTNGVFTKDGVAFHGVGVNYFTAFTRYAANGSDTSWQAGLATLHSYNIPFIRMNVFGFWASDIQAQYLNNKAQFYTRLDQFMNQAAAENIGVVMSLYFNLTAIPELNGEHYSALGNANSASRAMMRTMTAEIVRRYAGHPALWGWEFSNETNSFMDLPAASNNYQWLAPRNATNSLPRSALDNYTTATILPTMTEFSQIIRNYDAKTPIFSGNNISRFDSYHLYKLNSWDADTATQFGAIISRDNAGMVNTLTMHLYPESEGTVFGTAPSTYNDILAAVMAQSKVDGRPFFLGEFGTNDATLGNAGAKAKFTQITTAILNNKVPLSAAWSFDLAQQNGSYNDTATNSRAYQLSVIQAMNTTMKSW